MSGSMGDKITCRRGKELLSGKYFTNSLDKTPPTWWKILHKHK